ncbi:unnamed protein product [Phytomonas sp. Hart1]|nr:unnamed protein product [Phytomonas sp. Hart1]|eukprot:CCW67291.1 unnamed protein product [Phytomonas sp. isolate Hart1]
MQKGDKYIKIAEEFISFVNESYTPFHAVKTAATMIESFGFMHLDEGKEWPKIVPGGKYYITRNDTSIVAFTTGAKFKPENGLKIVGAHTDSPNFAIKPHTISESSGYQRIGVQCYGGGLWHTWFDRDLTVAGRVIVDRENPESVLIRINKPLMRIPTLAIHLCSVQERESFSPNKEKHLIPVISTKIEEDLNNTVSNLHAKHCTPFFDAICKEAVCKPDQVVDFDLSVIDYQEANIGGVNDEFIFAPRIDNLLSCFCAIKAITDSTGIEDELMARVVCLFDHEEVGSNTAQGAGGTLIPDLIERLIDEQTFRSRLVANSFLLSVDGAHAVHPNYPEKHESAHLPKLHHGPVIKYNANARYATNAWTAAVVKKLAKQAFIPIQEFVVKNDSPCGSTIGPILSTLSGIKTADIGNAMLSMHSIREMCGTTDVYYLIELIKSFFKNYKNSSE